jgi:hypothetical protein
LTGILLRPVSFACHKATYLYAYYVQWAKDGPDELAELKNIIQAVEEEQYVRTGKRH